MSGGGKTTAALATPVALNFGTPSAPATAGPVFGAIDHFSGAIDNEKRKAPRKALMRTREKKEAAKQASSQAT